MSRSRHRMFQENERLEFLCFQELQSAPIFTYCGKVGLLYVVLGTCASLHIALSSLSTAG